MVGAAVASGAARRGLSVCLVEKGDFASGTSSRSSKLIHGGQRYLETFDWALVRESCVERARLSRLAPHLVRPLPFLFPTGERGAPPRALLALGLAAYRAIAFGASPGPLEFLRRGDARLGREAPGFGPDGWTGAYRYFDAQADDALLTLAFLRDAAARGSVVRSHTPVVSIDRAAGGRARGITARDAATGEAIAVEARVVVAAVGPWANGLSALVGEELPAFVRPTRGSHFFLPAGRLPLSAAAVMLDDAGRRCYALPWRGGTLLGTTDADDRSSPDSVSATDEDRDALLSAARRFFPSAAISAADVAGGFAGLRPLAAWDAAETPDAASREERLHEPIPGLVVVVGGKLTTARATAARVLDRAERILSRDSGRRPSRPTGADAALPGGAVVDLERLRREVRREAFRRLGFSEARADRVLEREGDRALAAIDRMAREPNLARPISEALPYTVSDLVWGIEEAGARTAEDLLSRRVRVAWESPDEAARAAAAAEEALARYRAKPFSPGAVSTDGGDDP